MVKPMITGIGIIHRYGYDKQYIADYSNISKTEWDYDLPFLLTDKYRDICRCAEIGVNSAMLAYDDYADVHKVDKMSLGVYCGTAYGGFPAIQKKQCDALNQNGPSGILPSMSIHSGYHLTADIIAITYGVLGPHMPMVSGRLASGMAFLAAYDDIRQNNIKNAIVIGTEWIDKNLSAGLRIAGAKGWENAASGACTIVLSSNEAAEATEMAICVRSIEVRGGKDLGNNITNAITAALKSAELKAEDISFIVSAQGNQLTDKLVLSQATSEVFRGCTLCPIIYSADVFGDTWGAAFNVGIAAAVQKHKSTENILIVAFDQNGQVIASIIGG